MSGRLMPPTGLDPFKPFNPPSSTGNTAQSMLDAHTASMRSLLNMDNTSMQPQPPNNVPSAYYPSTVANSAPKDMPPAAHMFNSKSAASSSQSSATANLHQMLNNTMSMAYNANREQQHHQMHHQSQQQHSNQANAYGQHHQAPTVSAPTPTPPVPEAKPKRIRKKKAPATSAASTKPTADAMQNQILQQQQQQHHQHLQQQQTSHQQHHLNAAAAAAQQGFQSYSHLKTSQPNSKASSNQLLSEPNATSLKSASNSASAASVPAMVPGSAFNFGPSGAGLSALYGSADGAPSYMDDYRNTPNPYYIPPAHHRSTPDPNGGTGPGDKSSSAAAAAAAAAAAVAATSAAAAAGAPSSYHQFLSHAAAASSRASPYGFMGPASGLDPNAQMYQSAQLRQMMLGQGILGHGAPAAYGLSGYHPALGMHKSPYDPMGQMNRPPWYQ